MKIIATRDFELFGTHYSEGAELELPEDVAFRLKREGLGRFEAAEVLRHLKGKRLYTPAGKSDGMQFRRG